MRTMGRVLFVAIAILACVLVVSPQLNTNFILNAAGSLRSFLDEGSTRLNLEYQDEINVLPKYDFIIVGGGSAGCVLANRLSDNPDWKVLLIEAGPKENYLMDVPMFVHYLQGLDVNWNYKTKSSNTSCMGMVNNQCHWPRGRVMGGSSVLNFMIYTRGNRRDYDRWAELGNEGWSWNDVHKYFKKLEKSRIPDMAPGFLGKDGPVTISYPNWRSNIAKAFIRAGFEDGAKYVDYNGPTQTGFSFFQTTTEDGVRKSSNAAYLYPIKNRPNLHVKRETMVTKIVLDKSTKTAKGVQIYKNGKVKHVYAAKEVIVSAGAINTPQLLMLSGIGPAEHLVQHNIDPVVDLKVGYNLMDHTATALSVNVNITSMQMEKVASPNNLIKYGFTRKGPISSIGACESVAFYDLDNPKSEDGWPNVELFQVGGPMYADPIVKSNLNLKPELYEEVWGEAERRHQDAFQVWPMILRPKSRGQITLSNTNPFTHPIIQTNYFSHPDDIRTSVRAIRKTLELIETTPMKKIGARLHNVPFSTCREFEFNTDEFWACYSRTMTLTIYHYCGTCKMGPPTDPDAVVDNRLRVYGMKRLRVVDASIMPEIPAGHTNGPAMMVAEKAADMIKEEWGFGQG